jgi:hypothetical protein
MIGIVSTGSFADRGCGPSELFAPRDKLEKRNSDCYQKNDGADHFRVPPRRIIAGFPFIDELWRFAVFAMQQSFQDDSGSALRSYRPGFSDN